MLESRGCPSLLAYYDHTMYDVGPSGVGKKNWNCGVSIITPCLPCTDASSSPAQPASFRLSENTISRWHTMQRERNWQPGPGSKQTTLQLDDSSQASFSRTQRTANGTSNGTANGETRLVVLVGEGRILAVSSHRDSKPEVPFWGVIVRARAYRDNGHWH